MYMQSYSKHIYLWYIRNRYDIGIYGSISAYSVYFTELTAFSHNYFNSTRKMFEITKNILNMLTSSCCSQRLHIPVHLENTYEYIEESV